MRVGLNKISKIYFNNSDTGSMMNKIAPRIVNASDSQNDTLTLSSAGKNKNSTKKIVILASIIGAGAVIFALLKNKLPKASAINTPTTALPEVKAPQAGEKIEDGLTILKNQFQETMSEFGLDYDYIKNLAANIGLKEGEEYRLSSVVGTYQLKKMLQEFTPADFNIGKNLEGARNLTHRVNLHNHTTFSDGRLTPEEFLEQARKYADRVAKSLSPNDKKPPFTIAITDHDTMDGCIEALKIISQNPLKYKNLKVVLGSEISVSNCDKALVSNPLNFELVGYAQNPFDERLKKLLENIQQTRSENVEKFLEKINSHLTGYNLNLEEAKSFHRNLGNMRTNGVLYLSADYAKFKVMLSEYIKKINEKLGDDEKLSAEKLFKELGDDYYFRMDAFGEKSMKEYFLNHGLKKYLDDETLEKISKIDLTLENDFISQTLQKSLPDIDDRKKYSIDPNDVFEATTQGFYGFAHPAIINFDYNNISPQRRAMCDKKSYNYCHNLVFEIFTSLKKASKGLFCASEINYQSYPSKTDGPWIDFMKKAIADNPRLNLLYTGGLDSHKPSIFAKHQYLDPKIIAELLGE